MPFGIDLKLTLCVDDNVQLKAANNDQSRRIEDLENVRFKLPCYYVS